MLRRLSVSLDHGEDGFALNGVSQLVDVDAVIRRRMEDVDGVNGGFSALFVAEDEIDPKWKRGRNNVRL